MHVPDSQVKPHPMIRTLDMETLMTRVEQALYHKCIGGTVPVPLLVMEMQTGSTNNHIYQIFFVFAAPMYWWDWLAAP